MHMSSAKSHDSQSGWSWVDGIAGWETGVQRNDFIIRWASKKLRKRSATNESWRKSFWNKSLSKTFHAIVSVMDVKIQLSSPIIVRLSFIWPGIFSSKSIVKPGMSLHKFFCDTYQCKAVLIGVVKQAVNKSMGKSGCIGKSSFLLHAAKCIESRIRDDDDDNDDDDGDDVTDGNGILFEELVSAVVDVFSVSVSSFCNS